MASPTSKQSEEKSECSSSPSPPEKEVFSTSSKPIFLLFLFCATVGLMLYIMTMGDTADEFPLASVISMNISAASIHKLEQILNISINNTQQSLFRVLQTPSSSNNNPQSLPDTALSVVFTQYLDALCLSQTNPSTNVINQTTPTPSITDNINLYPSDCLHLLESMINISQSLQLDTSEIALLAQRIQYLSHRNLLTEPVLYIHQPKTGGTGFGQWLERTSRKKVAHFWVPDGLEKNMYDRNHYPDAKRAGNRRRRLKIDRRSVGEMRNRRNARASVHHKPSPRSRKTMRSRGRKKAYPQVVYGHLAYGFDILFLTPDEIEKLGHDPPGIVWKPRVNFTYITILRNPVTRVPSHYFYQKAGIHDENHLWTEQRNLYGWVGWFEESKDCMVQFVSGCHQRAWYSKEYPKIWDKKLEPWKRRQQKQSPNIYQGQRVTFDQYKIARRHLMEMPWVGLTEYLTESVEQIKVFWGIQSKQGDRKENVNRKKPKKPVEQRIIDKIIEFNQFDLALYDLGKVLFLQQELVVKYAWRVDINDRIEQSQHLGERANKFNVRGRGRAGRHLLF